MSVLKKILDYFNRGDLGPVIAVVTVSHYAKMLTHYGENLPVAISTGVIVDILHYQMTRRYIESRGNEDGKYWRNIAIMTTMWTVVLNFVYYQTSTVVPTYIGVILSLAFAFGIGGFAALSADREIRSAAIDNTMTELDKLMTENQQYKKAASQSIVLNDNFSPAGKAIVKAIESGSYPNGEITGQFGVGASTLTRINGTMIAKS